MIDERRKTLFLFPIEPSVIGRAVVAKPIQLGQASRSMCPRACLRRFSWSRSALRSFSTASRRTDLLNIPSLGIRTTKELSVDDTDWVKSTFPFKSPHGSPNSVRLLTSPT